MSDKDPLDFFPKAMIFAIVVFGLLALVAVGIVELF